MAPATPDECLAFLDEAKSALSEIRDLTARENDCRQKEQQSQRAYDAEKKKMNDEVSRTVRSRRDEIDRTYNDELAKDQDQLKKAKSRRERARDEGVKDRIADETQEFEKELASLRTQVKNLGQSQHLPAYCRSQLYISLYYPKHPQDVCALFICILICFALLPVIIYLCIPERKPVYMIFIYIVLFVLFVGLYIFVGIQSRKGRAEAIKDCRSLYDQIYEDKKSVRSTTRAIRKDKSEGGYDLAKYDDDISKIQQDIDEVTARKKDALDNYENVTKNILTDEIEGNYKNRLDELSKELESSEADLKAVSASLKDARLSVSDNYSPLLGKEFCDPVKIDTLINIVKEQNCQNLSEAASYYRANEKQMRAEEKARKKAAKSSPDPDGVTDKSAGQETGDSPDPDGTDTKEDLQKED